MSTRRLPPEQPRRRLVVDHQISWKVAKELRARGYRDAMALFEMDLHREGDRAVIQALADGTSPSVLVTFDQDLPYTHRDDLIRAALPVAVLDSEVAWAPRNEDEYKRDVLHRWAHAIASTAEPGYARWYSDTAPRPKRIADLPLVRVKRRGRGASKP